MENSNPRVLGRAITGELLARMIDDLRQMRVKIKHSPNLCYRAITCRSWLFLAMNKGTNLHGEPGELIKCVESWFADASRTEQPHGVSFCNLISLRIP